MARKTIGLNLDDNDMNSLNDNFKELYDDVSSATGASSSAEQKINNFLNGTGVVTNKMLGSNVVTKVKMANNSVGTAQIEELAVDGSKIANGAVTGNKLAFGSVYGDKYADNAMPDGKMQEKIVGTRELKDKSVGTEQIKTRSITWAQLDEQSVPNSRILDGTIQPEKTAFDSLTLNKGKDFPMLSLNSYNIYWRNGFLDVKVNNAEEGALYRLNHVSKDSTTWGAAITFFQFGKSTDGGDTWELIIARNQANLPNNQTGIKTHVITKNDIEEVFNVTLDWDVFETSSMNSIINSAEYIIHPTNYLYSKKKSEIYEPYYVDNKGEVAPFVNRGTTRYHYYDDAILELKVFTLDTTALYRVFHISKDNTAWGEPITFIGFQKSTDNGTTWNQINGRTDSILPNGQTGIKTHIISHDNMDEVFTIVIDWNALNNTTQSSYNLGNVDYVLNQLNHSFRRSSNQTVKDLEDNIVVKIDGRQVMIKHKMNDDKNMIVEYNKINNNDFHDITRLYTQSNTANDRDFSGTQVAGSATDWVSPYGLRAVNNSVSNNAGSITVGGAHGTDGGSGFPTGRFGRYVSIKLDGSIIGNGTHKGKSLELIVEHFVSASNVVNKSTGVKRDTMKETRTYTITSGSHAVHVELSALEKLELTRYAGLQLTQPDYYTGMYRYENGAEGVLPVKGLEDGFHIAEEKNYKKLDRAVLFNDESMLVMLTDRAYGIGDGHLAPADTEAYPQSPINITGGQFGKIYSHNLGRNNNSVVLQEGESLSYRGGYYFVERKGEKIIPHEDKLLHKDKWISFQGVITDRPNKDMSVYGPFDYKEGLSMSNANYVNYYDSNGNFIRVNSIVPDDNFKIPHVANAHTITISIWHNRLPEFKLIKNQIEKVFEYDINGVTQVDDLR